jgi:hypothetical protein
VKKDIEVCFLCHQLETGKRFKFYSGVMKGGTTHRLRTVTVKFFERWKDLTLHEIHVCRACQLRLWRGRQIIPMVLSAGGAGVLASLGLAALLFLGGPVGVTLSALAAVAALALGGCFAYYLRRYRAAKPKYSQVELLVVEEASLKLPKGLTCMTTEQYLERYNKGIIE